MGDLHSLRDELAEHLHDCWPLLIADEFKWELVDEIIGFFDGKLG